MDKQIEPNLTSRNIKTTPKLHDIRDANSRKNTQRRRNNILENETILIPSENTTTVLPININQTNILPEKRTKVKRKISKLDTKNIQRGWSHINKIGAIFIGAEQYQYKGLNKISEKSNFLINEKCKKRTGIKRSKTAAKRIQIHSDELSDMFDHLSQNHIHPSNATNNHTFSLGSQILQNKTLDRPSSSKLIDKKRRPHKKNPFTKNSSNQNKKIVKKKRKPFESLRINMNLGQLNETKKILSIHRNTNSKDSQRKGRPYNVAVNNSSLESKKASPTMFEREETRISATVPNRSSASTSQQPNEIILQVILDNNRT